MRVVRYIKFRGHFWQRSPPIICVLQHFCMQSAVMMIVATSFVLIVSVSTVCSGGLEYHYGGGYRKVSLLIVIAGLTAAS